jgi:hypothetical protein
MNQTGVQTALAATTGAAVALTIPTGNVRPTHAIIVVATNSIRWRADGTAPTASIGILTPAGSNIEFMDLAGDYSALISNFKAIGISGTAALDVAFFVR